MNKILAKHVYEQAPAFGESESEEAEEEEDE